MGADLWIASWWWFLKDEAMANEGMKALLQLDSGGSISINRYALVSKRADGTTTVEQANNPGSLGTLAGTSLGSLNGLLGVPTGLDLATAEPVTGALVDLSTIGVSKEFADDVIKLLLPNRLAIVAGGCRRMDNAGGHTHGAYRRNRVPVDAVRGETSG